MTVTSNSYPNQTGLETVYEFGFELISNTNLYATINGIVQAQTEYTVGTPSANQVTFNAAPVGDLILYRVTSDDPIRAVFAPGSAIRAKDLNNNFEQLLFIAQETRNEIDNLDITVDGKVSSVVGDAPIVSTLTNADTSEYTVSITNATSDADGAMSAEDKTKLDNIVLTTSNNATFAEAIDGIRTVFTLNQTANSAFDLTVSVNGIIQQPNVHYTFNSDTNQITFISAPSITSEYWVSVAGIQPADGSTFLSVQTASTLPLGTLVASNYRTTDISDVITQSSYNNWLLGAVYYLDSKPSDVDLSSYATINYVTSQIGSLSFATTAYVDQQIAGLDFATTDYVDSKTANCVTSSNLEYRLSLLPTVPATVATVEDIDARIAAISVPELPSNLITEAELETRIASIPAPAVTQQDITLAATAVDAKFDMLRAAIKESTDFNTLKARLLAVLE